MPNEGVTARSQYQLTALLRYFQHGDFNAFCRAAEMVLGTGASSRPYFCANLLLAYQVAGLCEATNSAGLTEWWAAHREDIRIRSKAPKQIGVTKQWFDENAHHVIPVIVDASGGPLVLGSGAVEGDNPGVASVFGGPVWKFVPAFRDIEKQLCVEAPFSDGRAEGTEVFNSESGRWEPAVATDRIDYYLSRIRKEFGGFTYYVNHDAVGVRFRVTQPEWAFVVAYHILPWRLSCLFRVDGKTVRIHRAVRLPVLFLRALFASSGLARIGPEVVFENVRSDCCTALLAYFRNAGDRQ